MLFSLNPSFILKKRILKQKSNCTYVNIINTAYRACWAVEIIRNIRNVRIVYKPTNDQQAQSWNCETISAITKPKTHHWRNTRLVACRQLVQLNESVNKFVRVLLGVRWQLWTVSYKNIKSVLVSKYCVISNKTFFVCAYNKFVIFSLQRQPRLLFPHWRPWNSHVPKY